MKINIGGVYHSIPYFIDRKYKKGICRFIKRKFGGLYCDYFRCRLNTGDCKACKEIITEYKDLKPKELLHCDGCSRSCDNVGNPNCDFYNLQ